MKRINFVGILFLLVICISACKDKQALLEKIVLLDLENNIIKEITAPTEIEKILNAWDSREEVILKKRPVFLYVVEIGLNEGKVAKQWLYAPPSYIMLNSKAYGPIYKIKASGLEYHLQ